MIYDSGLQAPLLFGGATEIVGTQKNDTWIWNGTDWTQLNTTAPPSPRFGGAFAYHEGQASAVLFGGNGNIFLGDTWSLSQIPSPVQLTAVASRKIHGSAGTFDVDLPLTGSPGIECRAGGSNRDYQVIFTFAAPVTLNSTTVTPGSGGTASVSGAPVVNGNQIAINLTDVSNAQTLTINLLGVSDTTTTGDVHIPMSVLIGDTSGDGFVNSADIAQTKSQSGVAVTSSNFREDVTADSSINSADIALTKSKSGTALP
jgi:hypothetical protein